jgi:chromosome segregation ATPase
MEEMCSILCHRDADTQAVVQKYRELKRKHRKTQSKLEQLYIQCAELNEEINQNRKRLSEYRNEMHRQEQKEIDAKLGRLEQMVGHQIEGQKKLISEGERTHFTSSSMRGRHSVRKKKTVRKHRNSQEDVSVLKGTPSGEDVGGKKRRLKRE